MEWGALFSCYLKLRISCEGEGKNYWWDLHWRIALRARGQRADPMDWGLGWAPIQKSPACREKLSRLEMSGGHVVFRIQTSCDLGLIVEHPPASPRRQQSLAGDPKFGRVRQILGIKTWELFWVIYGKGWARIGAAFIPYFWWGRKRSNMKEEDDDKWRVLPTLPGNGGILGSPSRKGRTLFWNFLGCSVLQSCLRKVYSSIKWVAHIGQLVSTFQFRIAKEWGNWYDCPSRCSMWN